MWGSISDIPSVVSYEVRIKFRSKIVFSLDPNESIALRYQRYIDWSTNGLGITRYMPFE